MKTNGMALLALLGLAFGAHARMRRPGQTDAARH